MSRFLHGVVLALALLFVVHTASAENLPSSLLYQYYGTTTASTTATTTPPKPKPKPTPSQNQQPSQWQVLLQGLVQSLFRPPAPASSSINQNTNQMMNNGNQTGITDSPFNFGGTITKVIRCDPSSSKPAGTQYVVTVEGAKPGIFNYGPYSHPYQCGPAIVPGKNVVGSYTPGAFCDVDLGPDVTPAPTPPIGWMNSLPGQGTSCQGSTPPPPSKPAPVVGKPGPNCAQYQDMFKDALQQCGGNMLSGNVPGLSNYCPNYNNLTQQQRLDFWAQFAGSVAQPESSCNPNSRPANEDSNGLFQLTVGNASKTCPAACSSMNSSNIYDPRVNSLCGIAIMNDRSFSGIANVNACTPGSPVYGQHVGMDKYWAVLRGGSCENSYRQQSYANTVATMQSFPGCR